MCADCHPRISGDYGPSCWPPHGTERRDLQRLRGIHRLRGNLAGYWAVRVDRQRRVVFRYEDGDAYDIEYLGYH